MKLIKDEDIALAIQAGWLIEYEIKVWCGVRERCFAKVWKTADTDEFVFDYGDYSLNVFDIYADGTAHLEKDIVAIYKLSRRGNFIKVWERD